MIDVNVCVYEAPLALNTEPRKLPGLLAKDIIKQNTIKIITNTLLKLILTSVPKLQAYIITSLT